MDTRLSAALCVVIGLLFVVAPSVAADHEPAGTNARLSPEIVRIIEGNQATLDSVRSMQARIKHVGTFHFGTKGKRKLVEVKQIWFDGNHIRKDILEGRFIGKETEPLLISEHKEGADIHKGYFRPPVAGEFEIHSRKLYVYNNPSANKIFIVPPDWTNERFKWRENVLLKYQSARNSTLRDNVLLSAKNGQYFSTSREEVDGEDCILLKCEYTNVPKCTLKIWVVPSKGYCIKRVQEIDAKGKIIEEYVTTLKEYSVESVVFNAPVPIQTFSVAGIRTPACGATIINQLAEPKESSESSPVNSGQ
jgi:hypothetical protein